MGDDLSFKGGKEETLAGHDLLSTSFFSSPFYLFGSVWYANNEADELRLLACN